LLLGAERPTYLLAMVEHLPAQPVEALLVEELLRREGALYARGQKCRRAGLLPPRSVEEEVRADRESRGIENHRRPRERSRRARPSGVELTGQLSNLSVDLRELLSKA
jgi:hypothetical protein